jgi:hypothetical protein
MSVGVFDPLIFDGLVFDNGPPDIFVPPVVDVPFTLSDDGLMIPRRPVKRRRRRNDNNEDLAAMDNDFLLQAALEFLNDT